MSSIFKEEVERWFNDEGRLGELRQGLEFLRRSGVFSILRNIGTPVIIDHGENINVMAGQAHFAAGYQAALDHLIYFEKLFSNVTVNSLGPPDFGGVEDALKSGLLRKEDLKKDLI